MVFGFFDGSIPTQCRDNFIKIFTVSCKMDNITTHHYSFIMFFKTFKYQQDPVTQLYGAEFPKHHKQMLLDCIDIMENECQHYIIFTQRYGSDLEPLKKSLLRITTRKLTSLILGCMDTCDTLILR